jgi:hypothetical protein
VTVIETSTITREVVRYVCVCSKNAQKW